MTLDLWAIERASALAWPAAREEIIAGWSLRLTGGDTRRPNSANPLGPATIDPRPHLAAIATVYAKAGLPLLFRVPAMLPKVEYALAAAGLVADGPTRTLARKLAPTQVRAPEPDLPANTQLVLTPHPAPAWLAARATLVAADQATVAAAAAIVARLRVPACFALATLDGAPAALAYVALVDGLAMIESVRTAPAARRRGLAFMVTAALLEWAAGQGARAAVLQVADDNAPALALYQRLGFDRRLYDYHYRRWP